MKPNGEPDDFTWMWIIFIIILLSAMVVLLAIFRVNILSAFVLFVLSIVIHEIIHYRVAKHFGADVQFEWVPSKEKKAIGIFGYLPGVRMAKEEISVRECKWMLLSPFPVGIVTHFLIIVVALFPQLIEKSQGSQLFILGIMVIVAALSSYFASSSDFRDYKKHKTLMLGDTT